MRATDCSERNKKRKSKLKKSLPQLSDKFLEEVVILSEKLHFSPEDLITGILNGIDIESVFNVKIEKLEL